jgi:YfiR/HmsC-like
VALTASVLLAGGTATAQPTVTAPALKAAFIYNFAKFADWPADASPTGPLTICVLGDAAVADALDSTSKGRNIAGRDVVVSRVKPDTIRGCHVLYLTGFDAKRSLQIVDDLKNAPVLTVSDCERFAQGGGVAGLFVEGDKMRFAINVDAAQRARIHLSSRLLSLATVVKDDRKVP